MEIINKKTRQFLEGSIEELSQLLNLDKSTIYRWRSGQTKSRKWIVCKEKIKDKLIGLKFNKLLILGKNFDISKEKKETWVNCICDCGNTKTIRYGSVRTGNAKSCGCLKPIKSRRVIN